MLHLIFFTVHLLLAHPVFIVKLQMIHDSKLIKTDKSSSLTYTQRI